MFAVACITMTTNAEQITVAQALQIAGQLPQGTTTVDEYEVVGYVTAYQGKDGGWAQYGNQIFWITDELGSGAQSNADGALEIYQGVPAEMVYVGDKVSVKATLTNYNGLLETTKKGVVTILVKVERPAFSGKCKIDDLYYNLNAENLTGEVTYEKYNSSSNYSGLSTTEIPASVVYNDVTYNITSIGESAFSGCSNILSVELSNSITTMGQKAFCDCSKLTSVNIPSSITEIGAQTFYNCTSLTSIIIPANVTSIGKEAFFNCSGLTTITCEAVTPPALGINVFRFVDISIPLYVPAESIVAYKTATSWSDFTNIMAAIQTGIEEKSINQSVNMEGRKIFCNGQVLIERNGKVYTVTGAEVK